MNKKVIICTSNFNGGVGRVLTLLVENLTNKGYSVELALTVKQHNKGIINLPDIPVFDLEDNIRKSPDIIPKLIMLFARFIGKFNKDYGSIIKYYARNFDRINSLKKYFSNKKNAVVISFLNDPIFLTLLTAKHHKTIISERNDPAMFVKNKTTMAFIKKLYPKAFMMVCQSPSAEEWYKNNSAVRTTVIFNPVKSDLPVHSSENNIIVNFCRISKQKNLLMLVDAFEKLHTDYPDYILEIIGNAAGHDAELYLEQVIDYIKIKDLSEHILIKKGTPTVHEYVKDCAMFVSSSDFEGMSNSMLEAMAMGMPVVSTDCPAGGARAVITDHENGLLVPVGDAEAMYRAMKELIENPDLAEKLGKNAYHIRETQSVENIINQWINIIEGD